MSKKKVTIVVEPSGRGGAEFYVYDLATYAGRLYDLTVAMPFMAATESFRELLGSGNIDYEELEQTPGRYLNNFRMAVRFFRKRPNRFYHFSLNHPDSCRWSLLAAGILKVPYIITEHLVPPNPYKKSIYFAVTHLLFNPLKKFSYRRARKVIAVSAKTKEILEKNYGMPADKMTIIHNGIDSAQWKREVTAPNDLRQALGLLPGDLVLGCVARMDPEKGHRYLIRCLPDLVRDFPELKLILIGDGPLRGKLEYEVESMKLSEFVRFAGHRDDIPLLLDMVDIFVLPSLNEGFPFTILEAMASSKPVVATRVAGVPEAVLEGETGFLVPPGDPAKLGEALRKLIEDADLRKIMGRNAFKRVSEHFSRQAMIDRTINLYPTA